MEQLGEPSNPTADLVIRKKYEKSNLERGVWQKKASKTQKTLIELSRKFKAQQKSLLSDKVTTPAFNSVMTDDKMSVQETMLQANENVNFIDPAMEKLDQELQNATTYSHEYGDVDVNKDSFASNVSDVENMVNTDFSRTNEHRFQDDTYHRIEEENDAAEGDIRVEVGVTSYKDVNLLPAVTELGFNNNLKVFVDACIHAKMVRTFTAAFLC